MGLVDSRVIRLPGRRRGLAADGLDGASSSRIESAV